MGIDPRFVTVNETTRELRIELRRNDNFNNTVLDRLKKMKVYELEITPINDNMSVLTGTPHKLNEVRKDEYKDIKSKISKQKGESYKDVLERLKNKEENPKSEKKKGRPKGSKNKPKENE